MAQSNEQGAYIPDDVDDLVCWTFPCADCGEVGCPYMYGEDRRELEERLRVLVKQHELEARIEEADRAFFVTATHSKDEASLWHEKRIAELKAERERLGN